MTLVVSLRRYASQCHDSWRKRHGGTSGRLSLSWINKDRSLISTRDGGYEWVDRDDFRVTETRLLRDVATLGEVQDDLKRAEDDLLIAGDSGDALRALTRLPEFAETYRGKVKLVYIDPPFDTGQDFEHYGDGLEHSVGLTMMRDRHGRPGIRLGS